MIRGGDPHGIVPRDKPDDRGLSQALSRASESAQADERERHLRQLAASEAEDQKVKATRALFIDALYRAKALNGDAAFDIDDVEDLDAVEGMAERLAARRRARKDGPREAG